MVQVVSVTVFLVLLARLLGLPPSAWRVILGGAVLVLAGSQLLPPGTPLREDVRASSGALVWIVIAALPVLGYALIIRTIRRRTLPREPTDRADRPRGLVLIPDDAALARDTEAALAAEGPDPIERLSVAWRDEAGAVAGHARLRIRNGLAELELLWVAPGMRGRGIGSRLVAQAETEARLRGADTLAAEAWSEGAARFLARQGFRPFAALGARRQLQKPLR